MAGGRAGIEKVTVIDTSQEILDRIQEAAGARQRSGAGASASGRFARPGAWPALEFAKMEGEMLPVEPGTFDRKPCDEKPSSY